MADIKYVDIESEYAKNKETKRKDAKSLMEWINHQPHLPKINELQAILFLHSCYNSNEMAKQTIDNFFTVRTLCPDIFLGRNPRVSPLRDTIDVTLFCPLPMETPDGNRIIFVKVIDSNVDKYNFALQLRYFDMVIMSALHQYGTSQGHCIVVDMNNILFGHLTKLGPLTMKKFLYYLQEALPVRLKGLHYFNVVPFMDKVMALMKPFMKKELMNVLHLHNNVEDLCKFMPLQCLPKDYGGEADSLAELHSKIKLNLQENAAFFDWEDTLKVDESKRPGKPKNIGDVFGVEGTFKKLELD